MSPPRWRALDASSLLSYASTRAGRRSRRKYAAGRMLTLKSYVRDHGGGLLVVGGERAFGPGGYARHAARDMLPVRMDLRGKSLSTSVALILVMDVSGSMGGGPGGAVEDGPGQGSRAGRGGAARRVDQVGLLASTTTTSG